MPPSIRWIWCWVLIIVTCKQRRLTGESLCLCWSACCWSLLRTGLFHPASSVTPSSLWLICWTTHTVTSKAATTAIDTNVLEVTGNNIMVRYEREIGSPLCKTQDYLKDITTWTYYLSACFGMVSQRDVINELVLNAVWIQSDSRLIPFSVQSSFRIMDMCHSRPTNTVFDALNQNTIHFSRPPIAPAASSGLPLGYSNIAVHPQVRCCRCMCLFFKQTFCVLCFIF